MIYYFVDRLFNSVATIDTNAKKGIVVNDDIHTRRLENGTLLKSLTMDIYKKTGAKTVDYDSNAPYQAANIKLANYVIFKGDQNEDVCLFVHKNEDVNGKLRSITAYDLGLELQNGSATIFTSNSPQHIDYYVNREIYDTGWIIGINELGSDIKRLVDTSTDETPLARLQRICQAFDCEMSFETELVNLRVANKKINIKRKVGVEDSGLIFYSTRDVITLNKTEHIDGLITSIQDTNQGFNDLSIGDGRFFTRIGESVIYDREANALYGQGNTFNERFSGFRRGYAASSNSAQIDNYNELRGILEQRSQPSFSATVDFLFEDGQFDVGDYVTFIDEEYNPPLRLKARILKIDINKSKKRDRKAEIGNYQLLKSLISSDLIARQQQLNKPKSSYQIKLASDNGVSFIDGESKTTTITATIYKDGVDVTTSIPTEDILWFKVDKNGNHDVAWESINANKGSVIVASNDITEIATIRCQLITFENYFVQAIYFLNGLKELARKVLRKQTEDTVTSIHISDTHYATDSITRDDLENYSRSNNHIKNVAELTNMINIDYVVLNGDVHDGSTANKDIAMSNYREGVSTLGLCNCPYFISWGNHCSNSWGDARTTSITKEVKNYLPKTTQTAAHGTLKNVINNQEMYEIATRPSTIFNVVENSTDKMGYYYYDVPNKKMRVILLNSQDVPVELDEDGYSKYYGINVSGYRQKQITWFYNTLKTTPTDYTVAIYQHFSLGKRYSDNMEYYAYNYEMIEGIMTSFVKGTTYSRSYTENTDFKASISADFQGRKGKLAYFAHGHHHNDKITVGADGIVNYSIGCSVSRPKKSQGDRPLGTLQEDLWDVVILNTKNRRVDLLRFGKGSDRSFVY